MRAREFIHVIREDSEADLAPVRDRIISQIKVTQDQKLLNQVLAALSRGDVASRLSQAIRTDAADKLGANRDPDIRAHMEELARIISEVEGPYEEKIRFLDGLDRGYVNIDLMLSGKKVSFRELLTTGRTGLPKRMIERIFTALEQLGVGAKSKGPGEYALAVMSPDITLVGSGDIKVNGDVIEVKASGGRLGTTGDLKQDRIPTILAQHLTPQGLKDIMGDNKGLTLKQLDLKMNDVIKKHRPGQPPEQIRAQLVDQLVDYIFSSKPVPSMDKLKAALRDPSSSEDSINKLFVISSWEMYQGTAAQKFVGIMAMNFESQQLQYFTDAPSLYAATRESSIDLISSSGERGILASLTLRSGDRPTVPVPTNPDDADQIEAYAEKLINRYKQLPTEQLVSDVSAAIQQLLDRKVNPKKLRDELEKLIPAFAKGQVAGGAKSTPIVGQWPTAAEANLVPVAQLPGLFNSYAQKLVSQSPNAANMDPALVTDVAGYIKRLWDQKLRSKDGVRTAVLNKYPELNPVATANPAPVAAPVADVPTAATQPATVPQT